MKGASRAGSENGLSTCEEKLLTDFMSGDKHAFEEIVKLYHERMLAAARAIVRSTHDAEEIVQDAWIRAYRALPGFRRSSSLATWLHKIVINQARTFRRRHLERCSLLSDDESGLDNMLVKIAEAENMTAREQPLYQLLNREYCQLLHSEIKELPAALSRTLYLWCILQFSYREIAECESCPVGTVKSRIARGRKLLIKKMRSY